MQHMTPTGSNRARPSRCLNWTPQADARLARMALEGASIRALASAFGVGRQAAQQRAQKLGVLDAAQRKPPGGHARLKVANDPIDLTRASLPAGHDLTWGLINRGTCLEGACYPVPDAGRLRRISLASVAAAG